jgi:orotate phosphoribosyltransferase
MTSHADYPHHEDKQAFVDFLVRSGALAFGDFTTAAGRSSPYFVNSGRYSSGALLRTLSGFYARALSARWGEGVDALFGPAYKGIPLAAGTAIALDEGFGRNVPFCFNRKEVKDHGEGGEIVGHTLRDGERVVIVEDVISAGGSVRNSVRLLRSLADVKVVGVVFSVDRMERGRGRRSAVEELRDELGIETLPMITILEVMRSLRGRSIDGRVVLDETSHSRMQVYLKQHGPASTMTP